MSEESVHTDEISPLDRIRREAGNDRLRLEFKRLLKTDSLHALEHINHEHLHFCTLYLLQPDIERYGIYSRLSARNRNALDIANGIVSRKTAPVERMTRGVNLSAYSVLRWMFETGCRDDGLESRYDELLELTACILVKTYRDASILQDLADMIFLRNRRGFFIHHLLWAFFEARVPYSLALIAERLCSADRSDVRLALKLLGFIPFIAHSDEISAPSQYHNVLRWLEENLPFLYYTGEGFHMTGRPLPYSVSHSSKYLCKPVSVDDGKPLQSYSNYEKVLAGELEKLDTDSRVLLSGFSYFLYRRNYYQWDSWIRRPVPEQLKTAGIVGGLTW